MTEIPFNQISISGYSLSQVDLSRCRPAFVKEPDNAEEEKIVESLLPLISSFNFNANARDIIQSLGPSSELYLKLENSLKCKCGKPGEEVLKCLHWVCRDCGGLDCCQTCNLKQSEYLKNNEKFVCVSCESLKPRRSECNHYCLNCISYKLNTKDYFICLICSYLFNKEDRNNLNANCSLCLSFGSFFELQCGCFLCENCLKGCLKTKSCPKCLGIVYWKEVLRIKKRFKYRCQACFLFRSKTQIRITPCCKFKVCEDCSGSSKCCSS